MGKWVHRLSDVDDILRVAYCSECKRYVGLKWYSDKSRRCMNAVAKNELPRVKLINEAGGKCTRCGFNAEVFMQLEIDHIDNNPLNNDLSNLQVLCANCHKLVTYQRRQKR